MLKLLEEGAERVGAAETDEGDRKGGRNNKPAMEDAVARLCRMRVHDDLHSV